MASPSAKPVILAVDDDAPVLRAVERDLRARYGKEYRVVAAGSGAEALDVVRQLTVRGGAIGLFVVDQRMPGMTGIEFLGQALELQPDAKRVLLTAYADTEAAISAINASRLDYYLLKPWDPPEERLYPVLDDLLSDWQSAYRPGYRGLRVVGNRWSADSHGVRDFLARNLVPYRFLDVETSREAQRLAGTAELPLVILENGERLEGPKLTELGQALGLKQQPEAAFYDLAIVGAGPAGLASAVYGASEGLSTVLVDREVPGGQAGTSSRIENYLGFPVGLSGGDLARRAVTQARRFGVELLNPVTVASLEVDGPYKRLTLDDGCVITCRVAMISTGVSWKRLPAEGAEELTGKGVYYGAAMSEALHCKEETVYTVGAGNSAGQAALYFAQYADRVVMLVRGDSMTKSMSQYLVERIELTENIEVRLETEVTACLGEEHLQEIRVMDRASGEESTLPAQLMFIFIGAEPRTGWLDGSLARDEHGFLLTGPDLCPEHLKDWPFPRAPYLLETNVPGIFAAGDVRAGSVKRVASAVGEGSVAVHFMHRHLASL